MNIARWSVLAFCLIIIGSFSAYSQGAASGTDREKAFYNMTKLAPAEFSKGNLDRAHEIAEDLLKESPNWQKNWNYGNAIQAANVVLGRAALQEGEIDHAKEYLLAAGRTPGSPQLNSFGPDMTLAKDLLKRGEKDVVLEYFSLGSS
jgi:hypothetical protein